MKKKMKKKMKTKPSVNPLDHLSAAELEELQQAARATWRQIGYDCIEANGGKDIPRAQVVELVLDADHIETFNRKLSPGVRAFIRGDAFEAKVKAVGGAFSFARYGL